MIKDDEKEGEDLSSSQDAAVVQSPPVPIVPVVYDILLFGVTGFTGQLCAEYLMEKEKKTRTTRRGGTSENHNTSHTPHIRWATSARDPIKAEQILHTIAREVASATTSSSSSSTPHPPLPLRIPPILVADLVCADETNLRSIVQQTKVVVSCSGPFEKYSKTLVKVCAELGVYYADITGETDFVRDSITRHDRTAQKSGAVIISHCGNDCIPCDLTVFEMHRYAKRNGCELVEVRTYEDVPSSATMSGGTIATASFQLNKDRSNRSTRARGSKGSNGGSRKDATFDPMLMSTDGTKSEYLTKNVCPKSNVSIADMNGRTAGPWIMGPVMMNCVRRSNALIGYSKDFRYGDALLQQDSYLGQFQQIGTFLLTAGYVTLPSVFQYFVPKPGEGPSREIMENGYLTLHGFGTMIDNNTNKERKLSTRFQFNKDTGYLYTAVLLVETGLLLVEKFGSLSGGCQTPASALGNDLTQRIVKEMDATFDIKEV